MTWRIHLFAALCDHFNTDCLTLEEVPVPLTAAGLKELLRLRQPQAAGLIRSCLVAKNQAYAPDGEILNENDEIALIPPVSGGQGKCRHGQDSELNDSPKFLITERPLDIEETAGKVIHADHGASLAFIGTTREHTRGKRTMYLEYTAYKPMAVRMMEQIGAEIAEQWPGSLCAISHRIGRVDIGEASVVIAVSAPHRDQCYEASRLAIERLKEIVPIWKKEVWEDGSEWKGRQNESM